MALIELESSNLKLALQPAMGLQTIKCQIRLQEQWHNLMPDCTGTNPPLKASNFHMLPYSNRIKNGEFTFERHHHRLENGSNHAIHGALRNRPWRVVSSSASHAVAEYDTVADGKVNWPWPIRASASYTLEDGTLKSSLELTNLGDTNMPAGAGWHPYFCRKINGSEPRLTLPLIGVYPDTDGDCLPVGAPVAVDEALDFTQSRALDAATRIDHCFNVNDEPVTIDWQDAGVALRMQSSQNCTHLVLFNPDKPYFAVEPVTNANDAFNLSQQGIDSGTAVLAPQQSLRVDMQLELANSA